MLLFLLLLLMLARELLVGLLVSRLPGVGGDDAAAHLSGSGSVERKVVLVAC